MDTKLLRQKILDLAIHGKLVPQNPADEPASVLLERIKAEKEQLIKAGKIKKSAKTSDTPHYDNVPFEIPSLWEWCKLIDITALIEDCPHTTAKDEGKGYPLIRTPNIGEGHLLLDGVHRVSKEIYDKRNTRAVPKTGDIIYAREASAGNAAVIKKDEQVCLGQRTVLIRPMDKLIDSVWLVYTILSPYSRNHLISKATGSTVTHVNMESIRPFDLPLPPLNEQHRIVAEIEKWFSLIDIIESSKNDLQSTIKQTKSKILDLAIHGKLVPQNPKDEPAIELLKRINPKAEINCDNGKNSFEVPNGWCWTSLKDIFLFIRNGAQIKQAKSASGLPITRIETISNSIIDRNRMGYADINNDIYSDYYIKNGDILMSHINSPKHVGKCALCTDIKKNEQIIHGMNLLCLRPYYTDMSKYIFIWFKSATFIQMIHPYVKNAVNQASLNIRNLGDTIIPIPPLEEQQRIVTKIEELFAVIDNIQKSLEA